MAVIAAVALMGGLLAAIWWQRPATIALQSGTLLPTPRVLGDFHAVDQDGQALTRAQLQGHWTLIFPGFTTCPDICPTTLALLKQVDDQLGAQAQQLRIAFLSIDPARDTPARLKQYVQAFDPQFMAITADEAELQNLTRMLGVAYAKVPGKTPDSYTMDHSSALILLDPQARIAGYMTPPFDTDKLSADLRTLLNRS